MVKDDNDLLYEWLAYHYTTLPLRYIVIGSDLNNRQHPDTVLRLWNNTHLRSWVLSADEFINKHGNYEALFSARTEFKTEEERRSFHHHALIHRQKGFVTACTQILQREGVTWTIFIDSDEFLVMNPMTKEDETLLRVGGDGHFSISNHSRQIRTRIRDDFLSKRTVAELIHGMQLTSHMGICYTIPRLLFGTYENSSCANSDQVLVHEEAKSFLKERLQYLNTMRFLRHGKKGDFASSKFGKVMIDVSALSRETVTKRVPSSIHRPFRDVCGPAGAAHFPNAYFFAAHYIGGWERYSSREGDHRRNYGEWSVRSSLANESSTGMACAAIIPWLQNMRHCLGDIRTQILLGVDEAR